MREHLRSERKAQHCFIALVALADPRLLAEASGVRVTFKFAPVPADRTTQETTQQTTQEMASTPQDRICHLLRGEPRLTRNKLAERLSLTPGGVKSQVKAVPHSQSHGHHSVKASVTLPGLLRQNPKMNMDKGALVRAVGTGSKQPAIHRFPFENQPMTIRTTAAITVVGDIPVCTRACHGVAEAGENAGRSAGTNAGTNAEKASEKASVSLKKLLGEHASLPFNPLLANAFFRAGEIEAWGRGIHRIFQACREAATPAPQIRYETNELWLEFAFSPDYLSAVGGGAGQKPERGEKWGDKWGDKWGEKALTTRLRIARAMRRSPRITTAGLAVELGMSSTSGIEKHLRAMREGGCIRRVGAAKGGYWEVIS